MSTKYADLHRHLAFAVVGGFFGGYAVLSRCGVMANAQTMNLMEMVLDALGGKGTSALLRLLCVVIYIAGAMSTVLLPRLLGLNMRRLTALIDALAAVAVAFMPEDCPVVVSLYPIFFAMSVQYSAFAGARGYSSSSTFCTNNTRQTALALANFLCDRDRAQLKKAGFFAATLLVFHLGATVSFFAVKFHAYRGALWVLPLVGVAYVMVRREELAQREQEQEQEQAAA